MKDEKKTSDESETKPTEQQAETVPMHLEELPEERSARLAEARKREILAFAPPDMKDVAERCILEDLPVEEARKQITAALSERAKPSGTPEPQKIDKDEKTETKVDSIDDETLTRSLCG